MQVVLNEHGTDRRYEDFPGAVITQYYDKDQHAIGIAQRQEFYTLASYLLWAMAQATNFPLGSNEYSEFSYFVATRPIDDTLMIETQYVIRSYTLVK